MTAKDLKNALLQEAIQGKLCHSDDANRHSRPDRESQKEDANCHPELDSGSHLLKQIKNEMLKRVQHDGSGKGKLKKQKPLPPVTDQEKPFEIPDNWCWCRLGEVCEILEVAKMQNHQKLIMMIGF